MDRIVAMLSPVKAPILMVYKDGEVETIGGVTLDNVTVLIKDISNSTDIKTIDMYGLTEFTHHIGEKLTSKYVNSGFYIKYHN